MADSPALINLVIIGNSGVGKSCIILRFSDHSFTESFITTTKIGLKTRTAELDGKWIKFQIWDSPGKVENLNTITKECYRGARGILLVYDVTDESSFNNIRSWIRNIEQHACDNVKKILVGNKADESKRVVPTSKGKELANEYDIEFFETSAKTDFNVEEVFFSIARDIMLTVANQAEDNVEKVPGCFTKSALRYEEAVRRESTYLEAKKELLEAIKRLKEIDAGLILVGPKGDEIIWPTVKSVLDLIETYKELNVSDVQHEKIRPKLYPFPLLQFKTNEELRKLLNELDAQKKLVDEEITNRERISLAQDSQVEHLLREIENLKQQRLASGGGAGQPSSWAGEPANALEAAILRAAAKESVKVEAFDAAISRAEAAIATILKYRFLWD